MLKLFIKGMTVAKHKKLLDLRPHHRKPYRKRHLVSLLLTSVLVLIIAVEIGIIIGQDQRILTQYPDTVSIADTDTAAEIWSGYGFSFVADQAGFIASGVMRDSAGQNRPAANDELSGGGNLVSATVRPRPGTVSGQLAASRLTVEVNPTLGAAIPSPVSREATIREISRSADTLGGVTAQKIIYSYTARQGGTSYSIVWRGTVKERVFAVSIQGLVGGYEIPAAYAPLLQSLQLQANQAVLGATSTSKPFASQVAIRRGQLDPKYLADAFSPAVVQIFHTVCGVLTVDGERLGDSGCISFTGSGFLTTANGYIATNGHVVVYGAKDAVANLLVSNENVLQAYLHNRGLSGSQIAATKADPPALAAQIAKIYDLSDDELHFSDKGEIFLVALGADVPDIKQLVKIKTRAQLAKFQQDSATLKQAKLVAYNYSAKDAYTTISNPDYGFSSSDVALLKINVRNAPTIPLATEPVLRNQKIIVMGFPGDAGNPLIDNTQTDVTVTDGVISAIRTAAGGKGKLYQSNADASHGNSGGPAIDEQGRVIGLLTYRYADGEKTNAAKSYIRDITDFSNLANAYDVKLDSQSQTQLAWQSGLQNYSRNHYSAALKDFAAVQAAYPAHRLVDTYLLSSRQAIADGKDVKDRPLGLLIGSLVVSLLGVAFCLRLVIQHRAAHHVYKAAVEISDSSA